MRYSSNSLTSFAISRAKLLLRVSQSPANSLSDDVNFIGTKNGGSLLFHARSKDPIASDTWVPLYRMGNVLGIYNPERPINLEEVEHVIF